jgi:hypothetical protein
VPLLIALGVVAVALVASVVLLPISLIQRYRMGTARRPARSWFITLNLIGLSVSTLLLLVGSGLSNFWVPAAFRSTVLGLLGGCALGVVGLALTRWEHTRGALYYTPNRWLVLMITVVVASRIGYGFWRTWQAWQTAGDRETWFVTAGVAGSLAAGAVVLGYYLTYWAGVRRRLSRARRG